jgi:hypothetical protein
MKRATAFVLTALLSASGCREIAPSDYAELTGKIFVFNYRVATATYVVTLGKLRPLPEGAVAETWFDDPRGGDAIVVTQKIWPKLEKIAIESPPVFCIVKDRPYKFSIVLKSVGGAELQRLEGAVVSSLDQTVLPDVPLVVGNAYEPNPELIGRPNGKFPEKAAVNCPG